ncbi:MAG: peptide deformylase [Hyphomicrobiales bacterium]|nr:peptide deformylase [Hyphomicrobiales bacterium]
MAVRGILMFGDDRLRQKALTVDLLRDDWQTDAADLIETLASLKNRFAFGNALAGPQIGSRYRMIAFDGSHGSFLAINPRITWFSAECSPFGTTASSVQL